MSVITKHYWVRVNITVLIESILFYHSYLPFFFPLFFAVSPSRHHKQKKQSSGPRWCPWLQCDHTFTAETWTQCIPSCKNLQHPSAQKLPLWGWAAPEQLGGAAAAACAAAPAGCVLCVSSIGAVFSITLYKPFWISYALLGSEAINWVLLSLYLIF